MLPSSAEFTQAQIWELAKLGVKTAVYQFYDIATGDEGGGFMSSKVKPAVAIVLDKKRHLLFDLNAMVSFEDATCKNLFKDEVAKALGENISPKDLRALLWACLIHEDEELTLKQVGGWMNVGNILDITVKITEAFSAAMPEGGNESIHPLVKKSRTG